MSKFTDISASNSIGSNFGFHELQIFFDAMTVVTLRTLKIAYGGDAGRQEATLMMTEKIESAFDLTTQVASGKLGMTGEEISKNVLKHYGKKIRANKKRLLARQHG
ncbi:MAG: hypothetical protein WBO17_15230 [Sphingorhabdus sp.]